MLSALIFRWFRGCLLIGAAIPPLHASTAAEPKPAAVGGVELLLPGEPGFRFAGYHVADDRGFFAEEGVTAHLRSRLPPEVLVDAVVQRPAMYAVGDDAFLVARLEGRPLVMIAAIMQETGQALALAEPAQQLAPAGLRGARIALRRAAHSAPLRYMLHQAGIGNGWHAVDEKVSGFAPIGVDAWQVDVTEHAGTVLRPADHGAPFFYGDALYTTEAELAYHPDRVAAVRRAVLRGWDYALKNTRAAVMVLEARRADLRLRATPQELLAEAEWVRGLVKPSVVPLGAIERHRVQEVAEALVELKLAPQVEYLQNFVYSPPSRWLPRWVYWAGGALGILSAGGLVMLLFNVRLQRRVLERTQELRRSEERARAMFEHAPVAILEQDFRAVAAWVQALRSDGVTDLAQWMAAHPDTIRDLYQGVPIVQANAVALRMAGASDAAGCAAYFGGRASGGFLPAFQDVLQAIWRDERALSLNLEYPCADGSPGYALLQWTVPLEDGQPNLARVLVVITDLTALRKAEARVRQSEARFRSLFENAIEGVYESTPADGIVVANPAFARMLGCESPSQLITWCRRVGAEHIYVDPQRRRQFLASVQKLDVVFDFESEIHCVDGQRKWISENVRVVRDDEKRVVRVEGFVSDISERKRFEKVIGEERERLSVTLRAMVEGVITTDGAGLVQYVNEAAEHLTGWAEGAAIGRRLEEICVLRHERSRSAVEIPLESAMRGLAVVDLPRSTQLVDRQGVTRLVEGRCAPIHDADSRPVGVVLVLRDVAERSRLEAEMARNTKLESLGVLAGGIAHDFNNLLTVILGNVSLTQMDRGVAAKAGKWLRDAEIAAVRARELTHQLLTFAKGGDPIRTAVRLGEIVREAADFALHGSRVRLEFTKAPDLWPADVDKGQIGQVVQNLVINAVQAMPDGGVIRIKVINEAHPGDAVRAIAAGPYLRLEIGDEGCGIRPENLSRIFDPYYTTKSTGSGLGLAMVYSIVKKHEGHIEVDSEVGRGTRFTILLPALPTAQPVAVAQEAPLTPMTGRVLFMDDEQSICRMAATLLERLGLHVTAVHDGSDVLREYVAAQERGQPYDVVMMDLTVPGGMGGREAMESLLKLDPDVRAVVSSGYSSDPVLANHRAYGFRGRVAKPYRTTDLVKALREVMAEESDKAGVS